MNLWQYSLFQQVAQSQTNLPLPVESLSPTERSKSLTNLFFRALTVVLSCTNSG